MNHRPLNFKYRKLIAFFYCYRKMDVLFMLSSVDQQNGFPHSNMTLFDTVTASGLKVTQGSEKIKNKQEFPSLFHSALFLEKLQQDIKLKEESKKRYIEAHTMVFGAPPSHIIQL